jgi:uncharacterized membrane protein affecting hemolysin expression
VTYSVAVPIALFIILHTGTIAFLMGRLFQRVSAVEKNNDALSGLATSMARLEVHLMHQSQSIDELKTQLGAKPSNARRSNA